MILAENNVEIGTGWSRPYLLEPDFLGLKLDVNVKASHPNSEDTDFGPVIFQTTESEQQTFSGADAVKTEQFLDLGFHSRPYVTAFTAVRFRAYGPLGALIDFTVYG